MVVVEPENFNHDHCELWKNAFTLAIPSHLSLSALIEFCELGFDGGLFTADHFDQSGFQYFTEWCRELRFSPIWCLKSEVDLQKINLSDAPYVAFFFDEFNQSESDFVRLLSLRRRLSQEFIVTCLYVCNSETYLVRLAQVGFDCFIDMNHVGW